MKRKDKESEKVGQQENLHQAAELMLTNITGVIYQSAGAPETFKHLHHVLRAVGTSIQSLLNMYLHATYPKLDFYSGTSRSLELRERPADRREAFAPAPRETAGPVGLLPLPGAPRASRLTAGPDAETRSDHLSGPHSPCYSRQDTCIVFLFCDGGSLRYDRILLFTTSQFHQVLLQNFYRRLEQHCNKG